MPNKRKFENASPPCPRDLSAEPLHLKMGESVTIGQDHKDPYEDPIPFTVVVHAEPEPEIPRPAPAKMDQTPAPEVLKVTHPKDDETERKRQHQLWLQLQRENEVKRLLQIEAEMLKRKQQEEIQDVRYKVKSVKRSFKKPRFVCSGAYQDWTNTFSRSTVHWDKHQEILDMDKDRVASPIRDTDLCCGNSPSRSPHREYSVIHRSKCGSGSRPKKPHPGKKAYRPGTAVKPTRAEVYGNATPSTAYKTPQKMYKSPMKSANKGYRTMNERKTQSAVKVRQNLFATPSDARQGPGQQEIYDIRTKNDSQVNLSKEDLMALAQNLTTSLADPHLKNELMNASVSHEGHQMSLE